MHGGPRLIQLAEPRQSSGEIEMRDGRISVGFEAVLPVGEHRSNVVWSATRSVPRQAQRPHRLSFWGLLLANGLLHTTGGVVQGAYNTGLRSAAILFVPLSVWVIYACVIRGPYSGKVVGVAGPTL